MSELDRIIEGMVRRYMSRARRFKRPGPGSPHGIYRYDVESGSWILVSRDEPFKPEGTGVYLVYFDNTDCPACRRYDYFWFSLVPEFAEKGVCTPYIVLCKWFHLECDSEGAKRSFELYGIRGSPTTIILSARDGGVVYSESYRGLLLPEELREIVEGFPERAAKAAAGMPVKPVEIRRGDPLRSLRILEALLEYSRRQRRG